MIQKIILQIFDYLFTQNAPLTIGMLAIALFVIFDRKRIRIPFSKLKEWRLGHEIFKHQMSASEVYLNEIALMLNSNFIKLRRREIEERSKKDIGSEIVIDSEVHRYNSLIEIMMYRYIKDLIRKFYRDNHLHEISDKDFESKDGYMDKRINAIVTEFTARFDSYWWHGTMPSRIETREAQMKLLPEIRTIFKTMFREGRKISIDYRSRQKPKNQFLGIKL